MISLFAPPARVFGGRTSSLSLFSSSSLSLLSKVEEQHSPFNCSPQSLHPVSTSRASAPVQGQKAVREEGRENRPLLILHLLLQSLQSLKRCDVSIEVLNVSEERAKNSHCNFSSRGNKNNNSEKKKKKPASTTAAVVCFIFFFLLILLLILILHSS